MFGGGDAEILLGTVPRFFFAQNFGLHKLLKAMVQSKAPLVGRGVVSRQIGSTQIVVVGRRFHGDTATIKRTFVVTPVER